MAQVRAVVDADCSPSMNLNHLKVQHRHTRTVSQTGAVVAGTYYVRTVGGATGLVLALRAAVTEAVATGADRTVTIDLQKSTGGGAFATVLTGTLVFNNTSTLYTVAAAAIASNAVQAGDVLRITVAVAGAAGAQAQGLVVDLDLYETPS